jgi:hypothetical protein
LTRPATFPVYYLSRRCQGSRETMLTGGIGQSVVVRWGWSILLSNVSYMAGVNSIWSGSVMIASFQDMFEIAPMPSHRNVKFNPRMYLCSCCAVLATCDSCWFDFNASIVFKLNRVLWRNQTFYMTLVTGRLELPSLMNVAVRCNASFVWKISVCGQCCLTKSLVGFWFPLLVPCSARRTLCPSCPLTEGRHTVIRTG